ncbi:MAG: nitroreductase family protein [Paracoccaceae bacterium]
MPAPDPAVMAFLLSRRSRPAKTLKMPVPNRAQLIPILTAAARIPDHGKLEPWRFIVLESTALDRLAELAAERAAPLNIAPEKIANGVAQFADADLAVAVIASPKLSEKIPAIEQTYSAGAACLALLNAALASGWGANWLTGWAAYDRVFMRRGLGLEADESIVGFIHIGTQAGAPPERPRPDIDAKVTWMAQ